MNVQPDPSLIWSAVNKKPTRLWPWYFLTWPDEIFFYPKGKKLKNLRFLGGNFPTSNPNQRCLTQPGSSLLGWHSGVITTRLLHPPETIRLHTFDPEVNKRWAYPSLTLELFDLIWWDFFIRRGENWKIGDFYGNFQTPNQRWLARPGSKILTRTHHFWDDILAW